MESQFELVLLLLAIAAGVTAIAKKLDQPYPIALVVVGTIIGLVHIPGLDELKEFVAEDEVFRFAIISIFLPSLLGEATLKLPFYHLKENWKPILALALPGTLISFMVTGFLAFQLLGLSLQVAFAFAALMAATDPVSVLSIFKRLGVSHRLATVMEGESLVNDGVAVVLFSISSVYLLQYMEMGWGGLVLGIGLFFKVAFGGIVIGAVLAYIFSHVTRFYDDYPLEIIFSMILFYGSFFIAEYFHVSGVIAVVVAGIIFGNYGARIGMSPTTKLNIGTFWDVTALVANSLVFLMVGLEITRIDLSDKWTMIALAIVVVLIARSVAVYASLAFSKYIPSSWKHIFNWGGLKGSLSIALALSLPLTFPGREEVIVLAFGVVLFSLIIQGITIKPLVAILGVRSEGEEIAEYEAAISKVHRYLAGRQELQAMREEAIISQVVFARLDHEYRNKLDGAYKKLEELSEMHPELQLEQIETAMKKVLYAEHEAVDQLSKRHVLSALVAEREREEIVDLLVKKDG
ncbi:cation:proton antiporter [Ammoniphilus sp. 3BR4]|uniref:cation:proton antiporter n=1 Tax=Ammoniphilus sp. 3BR4 TaxID=3158265 RepID=UPI003465BF22